MKRNTSIATALICLLCVLASRHCSAQHYDLFYTCSNSSYSSDITYLEPKSGYVSIDIDKQEIVFHNAKDSEVVNFKHPDFNESAHEWRLSLPRDAGDSWDGYILHLDDSNKEALTLSRRYTMKGEGKYFSMPKLTMYKYPPLLLGKEFFLTCKDVPATGTDLPDLRRNEYACYKDIINTPKRNDDVEVWDRGDELVFTEKPYSGPQKVLYTVIKDPESLELISKPKQHGVYFNGRDKNDSTLSYEVFYGVNRHLDMAKPILELMVYKSGVYQQICYYGQLYSDRDNERDYVEYVPPVISGCQRCRGTGKITGTDICKGCHGRGYHKSTFYRADDQVIKRDNHSDGSQTVTYIKQGYSSSTSDCENCHGTGHTPVNCPVCGGTGKIKTPGR